MPSKVEVTPEELNQLEELYHRYCEQYPRLPFDASDEEVAAANERTQRFNSRPGRMHVIFDGIDETGKHIIKTRWIADEDLNAIRKTKTVINPLAANDEHLRFAPRTAGNHGNRLPPNPERVARMRQRPFQAQQTSKGKKRKPKPKPPPNSERDRAKRLLPDLNDGGRWSLENEGYGWKVRRVFDYNNTTRTQRRMWLKWSTWNKLKGKSDELIQTYFTEKLNAKPSSNA